MPVERGPVALDRTQRAGRLLVTPLALEEDSRCPVNARCMWAGRVVVRVVIDDGRGRLERRVTLGQSVAPGLVLDGVTPDRVAGGAPLLSSDYRFDFALAAPPIGG
jgi:hypothetical protein